MQKHEFTVAETFGGLGVAITISMDDQPTGFPPHTSGGLVALRGSRMNKVARAAVSTQLGGIAQQLTDALVEDSWAMTTERRAVEQKYMDTAINEARAKAEAEAERKIAEEIAKAQAIFNASTVELSQAYEAALQARAATDAELATLKTAKKREAALKGHRSARAGKGAGKGARA